MLTLGREAGQSLQLEDKDNGVTYTLEVRATAPIHVVLLGGPREVLQVRGGNGTHFTYAQRFTVTLLAVPREMKKCRIAVEAESSIVITRGELL